MGDPDQSNVNTVDESLAKSHLTISTLTLRYPIPRYTPSVQFYTASKEPAAARTNVRTLADQATLFPSICHISDRFKRISVGLKEVPYGLSNSLLDSVGRPSDHMSFQRHNVLPRLPCLLYQVRYKP